MNVIPHSAITQAVVATLFATTALSASAGANLLIQGDTVYDKTSNLTWQRCSLGMKWDAAANKCTGTKQSITFDAASEKKWDGGWRVPTIAELRTLLEKRGPDRLFIDSKAFPDTNENGDTWYWSSTPSGDMNGWYMSYYDGSASFSFRTYAYVLRLVKSGK
jgi:hypothetical protein